MSRTHATSNGRYSMILFVAEGESHSAQARLNLERICREHLAGNCDVRIVDVLQDYQLALEHNILVTPCLLVLHPAPRALIAGTLSDRSKVLSALCIYEDQPHGV